MKICVYAIAKNEAGFARRWAESMAEADHICVLDTGSTDGTPERLEALGAAVRREVIAPWRFDTARNRSLELVPEDTDICVCTDLDEVFRPGWRAALEAAWVPGTQQARYRYLWAPGTSFLQEKIHAPGVFAWHHPVHEVLRRTDGRTVWPVVRAELVLEHHPDPHKSRGQYLELLERSVAEDPEDDRNAHYLGREYLFRGMWDRAIAQLRRHLDLPTAVWRPERCASMRFLSRCFLAKGDPQTALAWALRAAAECPETREPWVQAQEAAYALEDWEGVRWFGRRALAIREKPEIYINEARAWGAYPYDALAYAEYRLGDLRAALDCTRKALELDPGSQRLRGNLEWYLREVRP